MSNKNKPNAYDGMKPNKAQKKIIDKYTKERGKKAQGMTNEEVARKKLGGSGERSVKTSKIVSDLKTKIKTGSKKNRLEKEEREAKVAARKETERKVRKSVIEKFTRVGAIALGITNQEFYVLFHVTVMGDEEGKVKITAEDRYQLFLDSSTSGKKVSTRYSASATISQNFTSLIAKGLIEKCDAPKTYRAIHNHKLKSVYAGLVASGWKDVSLCVIFKISADDANITPEFSLTF